MARFICAVLFGSLVLFTWNVVSWSTLNWHQPVIKSFNQEQRVNDTLRSMTSGQGIYVLPAGTADRDSATLLSSTDTSIVNRDVAFIAFSPSQSINPTNQWVTTGVISFLSCTIITLLLACTLDLSYVARVLFVTMIGTLCAILAHLPYWNWMYFETNYTLIMMADMIIGCFLSGIVIALFTGRRPDPDRF